MKKDLILGLCLILLFLSYGCNNMLDIKETDYIDAGKIVNYNCILTNNEAQRFIIPVILNKSYDEVHIMQFDGNNVDHLKWKEIESNDKPIKVYGYYVYQLIIEVSNIIKPSEIKSATIKTDNEYINIYFNKFKIDISDSTSILDYFSEYSIPVNIPNLYNGDCEIPIGFTAERSMVIDEILFNDFINIKEIIINNKEHQNSNIIIGKNDKINMRLKLNIVNNEYVKKLLFFNLIIKYHLSNNTDNRICVLPVMNNITEDKKMEEIYKSIIVENTKQ